MSINQAIELARDDHDRATNGRAPSKLKLGKKQMRAFEEWASQFSFGRDPKKPKGSGSMWDGVPIEAVADEDFLEFE